jgi:hypothetical protein
MISNKRIYAISILVFALIGTSAQDQIPEFKRSYLYISGGPTLPSGYFKETTVHEANSGAAMTGYGFSVDYTYLMTKNFGFAGSAYFGVNPMFTDSMRLMFIRNTGMSFRADRASWQSMGLLGGMACHINLGESFAFVGRFMNGLMILSSPDEKYSREYDNMYINFKSKSDSRYGFMTSLGFIYYLGYNTYLAGSYDRYSSLFIFDETIVEFKDGEKDVYDRGAIPFTLQKINFGLTFRF